MTPMQNDNPAAVLSATKGPRVFLDYDQTELDAAYNQRAYAPHSEHVRQRMSANSDAVRARIGAPRRVAYGPTEIEKLDIYPTSRAKAPVNIYIHGGAWRHGLAKGCGFAAELFVNAGAHFVVPDFVFVQDAPDSLRTMADQVRRAISWVYNNAASFGGDPDRLYLSGHSSGGHLAAVALTTDWNRDFGLPADLLKGGLCCSGMYDLHPVRLSARSSYVRFDDTMVESLSPIRHIDRIRAPLVVAYGDLETPEFQRQAVTFAEALRNAGKPVELLLGEGYNHYEIRETLGNPYGLLGRAVLQQMKLVK